MAITQASSRPAGEDTIRSADTAGGTTATRAGSADGTPGAYGDAVAAMSAATTPADGSGTAAAPVAGPTKGAPAPAAGFTPIPVWFFAFEGLMGASYDIVKSHPGAWMLIVVSAVVNIVLARTVLRGRLKMAKAILKGKRTRKLAVGLVALRIGVHVALGAVGMQATSEAAHIGLAVAMCAATVSLLAFDQRVMLRALAAS